MNNEVKKCIESPYYFYVNYFRINGEKPIVHLSEKIFNELINSHATSITNRK